MIEDTELIRNLYSLTGSLRERVREVSAELRETQAENVRLRTDNERHQRTMFELVETLKDGGYIISEPT